MYESAPNALPLETPVCPICGPRSSRLFVRSNERDVLQCLSCSLLYSSPRPSAAAIANYFRSQYIEDKRRVVDDFSAMREPALRGEANFLRRLLPQGGRLLDIGCASGAFLAKFVGDDRWAVAGIEPSRYAAEYARQRHGVDVHTGCLSDVKLRTDEYDAVTSLDAFYFHPDPNEDLREISRILRADGYLLIEIPGLRFRLLKNTGLFCRLLYGVEARLNAHLHLYFYSASTLTALVSQHGFELKHRRPQQGPLYGNSLFRLAGRLYFLASAALYKLTGGRLNIVPKEFLAFRSTKSRPADS